MPVFPITDPTRAADIRMRRKRALMLLAATVFVPWLIWGDKAERRSQHSRGQAIGVQPALPALPALPAQPARPFPPDGAGAQMQRFTAMALRVDLPCASSVSVERDDSLIGQATLSGPQAALDRVSIQNGVLSEQGGCRDDSALVIHAPGILPLTLVQSGSNEMRAGRFDGPVTVEVDGSGDVRVDHAGTMVVHGNRSGDISVGSVTGPLTATLTGSGDLHVDGGTIPVFDATVRGSADLLMDNVSVLAGRVSLQGSGGLQLGSAANTLQIDARGTAGLSRRAVRLQHLQLDAIGSGDVKISGGHIALLDAQRHGSGDLEIDAKVDDGRLVHSGSGDVDIPDRGLLKSNPN